MGATLSVEQDSRYEEDDEELYLGQDEVLEDSDEDKLTQTSEQISVESHSGKTESQTDEMNSQSEERDLVDGGSGFVTLEEDDSETTDNPQEEDFSRTSNDNISKQLNNADDIIAKEANEANNEVNENEIGFKKIFRFGGFKFTLKKDLVEKNGADKGIRNEQDRNASGSSEDSWDTVDVNPVSTNEQKAEDIKNERIGAGARADSHETHYEVKVGKISEHREEATSDKGMMEDVPEFEEPMSMSPLKRFFSQGMLGSLRKKKKEDERPKESEEKLKSLNKLVDRETLKEDTTCTCLEISNGTFDKDIQLYNKDESKPTAAGDIMNSIEQDKVQASPFKRLFRKLSTRRKSETKLGETNLLEPGENITENPQLSTDLITSQKEQETSLVKTQSADEMMDTSHEESKKKSDSTVSWENLICVRSAKTRARKTSDSEDETHDKGEVLKRTTESPFESSTEGDHLTSSNEQSGNPAEEDSGSTWKSFKKLVTSKRKSRMEESSSVEQMQSDTEISKDESSCSLRKLISGRKKIKPDGQQENMSSDEGSKGTVTDIEDDETPSVVPLSEYEIAKPEILNLMTDGTTECKEEKEVQLINEEDEPKQMECLYNVRPLCFDAGPSGLPIPTEYIEELTEFISKHQQLSDIPEEGIIEESVATPLSFVEWRTQDDTLADDIVDMTADAVTAPEQASENTEDETTEMVSALSQLSESPKTSGNVTPISPVRESDTIFQEVVESFNVVPRVLSFTTNNEVPEALAVSVSQFIVESSTTTETKLLVTHKKDEATSVCIGIVSQEIRAAEVVLPLPLFEGISETTYAVPTEFASAELANESEAAAVAPDNVYEAKIKEIKSMLHEVLLFDEQSTILAETAGKSKQHFIMVKNIQEEASPVVQMEAVDSKELLNGIRELTPVPAAVHGGTEYEEQNITLDLGPFQPVLEEPVPVHEQLIENTKKAFEVQYRLSDVDSSADDVEQCGLVAVAGPVAVSVVELVLDSSLNEVSKITEDKHFQVDKVGKSVVYNVADPESDLAMSQASEIIEDMTGVFASNVRCSETTPINNVNPISDSLKTEMDLEYDIQMKNYPSAHFIDSPIIRVKVTNTESQTAKENAVISLPLHTTLDASEVFKNIEMDGEEEKAEQKLERTAAETIEKVVDEKIVCTFKAQNFSEIVDKRAKKRECKQSEFVRERTLPIAITNDENANKEPQDVPKVMLELETDTLHVEYCKRKQTAGDEICMLTLNTTKTEEETKKPPATSEQPRVYEKVAESGIQPPTSDISKQVSQATFFKVIEATQTTAVSPESMKEKSAKIEAVKRPCVDNESDKLLADEQEYYYETASSEVNPGEPQKVISSSKSEKIQATKSKFTFEEETGVDLNKPDQPVPNLQCLNSIDRVGSLEEDKRQCVDDQSVLCGTLLAERQDHNETAKSEVNTEVITEHQEAIETVKTFPKPEPQLNTKNQLLSLQPGQGQPSESSLQFYEESSQITAEIIAEFSSDVYKEVTEVECKISDQTEETRQCLKGVRGVPVITTGYVNKILFKDKAEDPEGFVVSKSDGSANVMDVIEANSYKVYVEVQSETLTVSSEQNRVSPDVTEQDVVSEIDIANIAGAETQQGKTHNHLHEDQTVVKESPIVPENKTEILAQMINEFKAETIEASESKADISEVQAETSVVGSLVTKLEEETPVVTLTEKSVTLEALALTSVINTFQSDLKSVTEPAGSTGITLQETPIGVSGIQTATRLSLVQTVALSPCSMNKGANIKRHVIAEVTEPKLEMLMAREAKSYTSAIPAVEVQTIETSASETETSVGTCVEKKVEAQGSVVTSIKEDTNMGFSVLTTMDSETKLETVIPVGQTLAELTITDVPAIQKPTLPVAPEVQTQVMVQAEVQRPTVIPMVEILSGNSTEEDVEIPFTGPEVKERHCDAQTAVKTELKQPAMTEIEVKVTNMIEHVRQDVEKTTDLKEDTKSPEEKSGRLKEFSVESRPGSDDVWEDALDDFIDDQCSWTEASGSAQDTSLCHGDK